MVGLTKAFQFFLFFLLLCIDSSDTLSTMSIDLGSEFMKVAVVLPGVPMEIAINGDSKRKTPTAIGFRNNERVFGSAALHLATKHPNWVFQSLPSILGKPYDHPAVQVFRDRYPYHNLSYNNITGQLILDYNGEMTFTVDELVAMLLEHARQIAEDHTRTEISTCVLTVPSFYGQAERRRLISAARLAGLEVLQLINTNTAVALNFGLFRQKLFNETFQYFLFFDFGSSTTTATLASYNIGRHREAGIVGDHPILVICGVGYDPTLGTSVFVYRLRDWFAKQFNAKKKLATSDVTKNPQAMAKLYQEADRVFIRLSANTEIYAQIENLLEGEDFHLKITRAEMESLCSDLFERLKQPFYTALSTVDRESFTLSEIVLMGGGTRIPKVQSILMEIGQKSDLSKGVNGDEAAALGGVYQAAFHTPGFRVMRFVVKDFNPYAIGIDFERAPLVSDEGKQSELENANESESLLIRRVLFPRGTPFPQKRAITFNRHFNDFTFYVGYVDLKDFELNTLLRTTNLSRVLTRGVTQTVGLHKHAELRGVKAHFTLDYSGILTLTGIDCLLHPLPHLAKLNNTEAPSTLQKIGNTISEFFGGNSPKEDSTETLPTSNETNTTTTEHFNSSVDANQSTDSISNNTSTITTSANITSTEQIKTFSPFTERIEYELVHLDLPEIPSLSIELSRKKLHALHEADRAKVAKETVINELESVMFYVRGNIEDILKPYADEFEVNKLQQVLLEVSDWFEEQDQRTTKEEYDKKLELFMSHLNPIKARLNEAQNRPIVLEKLNQSIVKTEELINSMTAITRLFNEFADMEQNLTSKNGTTIEQSPWKNIFTDPEINNLQKLLNETKAWFNETRQQINQTPISQDPPVLVSMIQVKLDQILREYSYFNTKLELWRSEISRIVQEKQSVKQSTSNNTFEDFNKMASESDESAQKSQDTTTADSPKNDQSTPREEL